MSNKTRTRHRSREHKREQFSQPTRRNYNLLMLVVIAGLLVVIAYLVTSRLNQDSTSNVVNAKAIQLTASVGELRIPLSEIGEGKAKFFDTVLANGRSVRFFVIRTTDGVYRTALDACPVCFDAHKGYYQDGNDMVCRKCGRHFSVNSVGSGTSGCHPVALQATVDSKDLVIQTSALENGSQYF